MHSSKNAGLHEHHVIKFKISKSNLQRLAVDAVTKDGMPFSVFKKLTLNRLIKPINCRKIRYRWK